MKKNLMVLSGLGLMSLAPFVAFAQTTYDRGGLTCKTITNAAASGAVNLQTIVCYIGNILNTLIPILIVLGIVYFIWGVVTYVISSDEEAKASGKNRMIWGIVGLAVIVSMWGLVGILTRTFNVDGNSSTNQGNSPGLPTY